MYYAKSELNVSQLSFPQGLPPMPQHPARPAGAGGGQLGWKEAAALTDGSYHNVLGEVKHTDFFSFLSFCLLICLTYLKQFIFTVSFVLGWVYNFIILISNKGILSLKKNKQNKIPYLANFTGTCEFLNTLLEPFPGPWRGPAWVGGLRLQPHGKPIRPQAGFRQRGNPSWKCLWCGPSLWFHTHGECDPEEGSRPVFPISTRKPKWGRKVTAHQECLLSPDNFLLVASLINSLSHSWSHARVTQIFAEHLLQAWHLARSAPIGGSFCGLRLKALFVVLSSDDTARMGWIISWTEGWCPGHHSTLQCRRPRAVVSRHGYESQLWTNEVQDRKSVV